MGMTAGVRDIVFGAALAVLEFQARDCYPDDFTAWSFSA
jgi:hypothetical protein